MRIELYALGFAAVVAGGCATAGSDVADDDIGVTPDADSSDPDGRVIDGAPIDGMRIDGMPIDAMPIDANTCTIQNVQQLVSPGFDAAPIGTGWVQFPFEAAYPPISDLAGAAVVEQTAPYGVWLGGYETPSSSSMHQDLAIPASTTAMTLTGYRWVATAETTTTSVYDTATIQIRNNAGGILATLASYSNLNTTTDWTAISFPLGATYAGQTIRVYLASTTDISNNTNFFFDSFALTATVCQ